MTIRGVLFDKDGTLLDFPATWEPVLRSLAHQYAGGEPERIDELLAVAGYDHDRGVFRPGSVWAAGNTLDLVAAWLPHGSDAERADLARWIDAYCAEVAPDSAVPITDLQSLFDELAGQGLALGVATNDTTASAVATMQRLGVSGALAAVLGYDAVARPKPAADMVLAFCAAANIEPGNVAVVGDNLHDIVMARAAESGLAIGVLTGNGALADLEPHADHMIASVADLPGLLDGLARGAAAAAG